MAGFTTTVNFSNGDQVTSDKLDEIATGLTVTAAALAGTTLSVVGGQLKVGTITANEMGTLSVSTASLQDGSVTTVKIALGAVGFDQLGVFSVSGNRIANGGVLLAAINPGAFASKVAMESQLGNYITPPDQVVNSPASAKAYGEFAISGTGGTIRSNSFNIQSLSRIDSTHTSVSVGTNMNSDTYRVVASFFTTSATGENFACSVYDKKADSFKIMHPAEAAGRAVNFTVFGKYL